MTDKINDKTLEEILKALKCIVIQFNDSCDELWDDCRSCPHNVDGGRMDLAKCVADAAALIQRLEREQDELLQKNQQLQRERDEAVEDLEAARTCQTCGYYELQGYDCMRCSNSISHPHWKWRGVQEVK